MTMVMINGENDGDNNWDDNGWNKILVLALDFLELLAESECEGLISAV